MNLEITNREFAQKNKPFQKACKNAGLEPTRRQASKFQAGKGLAFLFGKQDKSNVEAYVNRQMQVALNLSRTS
jgi:hypothetical protein